MISTGTMNLAHRYIEWPKTIAMNVLFQTSESEPPNIMHTFHRVSHGSAGTFVQMSPFERNAQCTHPQYLCAVAIQRSFCFRYSLAKGSLVNVLSSVCYPYSEHLFCSQLRIG